MRLVKPDASRPDSKEIYLLALGYQPKAKAAQPSTPGSV